MANGSSNTANLNGKQLAMAPIEQDLEDLEALRRDMQNRVDQARDDGRIFMMQEYVQILAHLSTKINRIQARFNRETIAGMRKDHKNLKAEARAAIADANEA